MTYFLIAAVLLTAFCLIGGALVWGLSDVCSFIAALLSPEDSAPVARQSTKPEDGRRHVWCPGA